MGHMSLQDTLTLVRVAVFCDVTVGSSRSSKKVQFSQHRPLGRVADVTVDENSGLAASRLHPGILYGHNDKGDSSRIYAFEPNTGALVATFTIDYARNYDWEDIAVGVCGQGESGYCIYIGDIGDHGGDVPANIIYKVREPETIQTSTIPAIAELKFDWDEPDAQSLMVDPDGELYIISQVRGQPLFAKLPSSGWGALFPVRIPANDTVRMQLYSLDKDPQGADISPNGEELLVKFDQDIFYYSVPHRDYLNVVGTAVPERLPVFHYRENGEAIAWDATGTGFYTLPEGHNPVFEYYRKL